MTDVLAERCAALADVTVDLMRATMESIGKPAKLTEVAPLVARMQAVVAAGSEGISNPAYLSWAASADETLSEMADAVDRRDPKAAWAAFTHPTRGMAPLGQACSGYPRW